jgi:hypothetical protein
MVKTGPPASRVAEARMEFETPTGHLDGFYVKNSF